MAKLSDAEIKEEEKFLKGLPRVNWGAFILPGIWGPAHGFWICLLFYPAWLLVDYLLYGGYYTGDPWLMALGIFSLVVIIAVSLGFSLISQPIAAHHAEDAGVSRETYLKRQRIWAVVCLVLGVAAVVWATYYNINIREGW